MDVVETLDTVAERQLRAELRGDEADRRLERIEKKLDATANLVRAGMKLVIQNQRDIKELTRAQARTDAKIGLLADAQMKTDEKFNRLMSQLMRKDGNGRH